MCTVFMYSEENFWLKKTSQSPTSSYKKRKKKKKEGKSETVRRMRKRNLRMERDTKQGERISFVVPVALTF